MPSNPCPSSPGTCKMAPDSDEMGVVTPDLNVRGVAGLAVADASIIPSIVGANTNAAVAMVGEKAADLLLREAGMQ